jgi:hypothetical protein
MFTNRANPCLLVEGLGAVDQVAEVMQTAPVEKAGPVEEAQVVEQAVEEQEMAGDEVEEGFPRTDH